MDLYNIPGVEIFSSGTWNGDTYTEQDLDEMVRAFEENKQAVRPFLKLGHDDEQKLLQSNGLPAAGWVDRLYRVGEKLLADFVDIPRLIYELIERKAYRKVSSEIYWNISIGEKEYSRMLGAVALLGAETPGVMNLTDILGWYNLNDKFAKLKFYDDNKGIKKVCELQINPKEAEMSKTEQEIKLELELKDAQSKIATAEENQKAYETEKESLRKEIENLQARATELEKEKKEFARKEEQTKLVASVESLIGEKLITPAMKPYMIELLGEEKKEYSFKQKDEEKKLSKFDLVKEILKLHSATDVNLDENSEDGESAGAKASDLLNSKIEAYSLEHKVGYKEAYKAVMREQTLVKE